VMASKSFFFRANFFSSAEKEKKMAKPRPELRAK